MRVITLTLSESLSTSLVPLNWNDCLFYLSSHSCLFHGCQSRSLHHLLHQLNTACFIALCPWSVAPCYFLCSSPRLLCFSLPDYSVPLHRLLRRPLVTCHVSDDCEKNINEEQLQDLRKGLYYDFALRTILIMGKFQFFIFHIQISHIFIPKPQPLRSEKWFEDTSWGERIKEINDEAINHTVTGRAKNRKRYSLPVERIADDFSFRWSNRSRVIRRILSTRDGNMDQIRSPIQN